MIRKFFCILSLVTLATSCTKDNFGNDKNSGDTITMNVSASMPTPKQETMLESRTVVDQITNNYISLKWTNTDKKAYAITLYTDSNGQQLMGRSSFNIDRYSDDMKSVYFNASFNSGFKEAYFYYPYANTIDRKTKVLTIPAEQTKAGFNK